MEFQRTWELADYGDDSSSETHDTLETGNPPRTVVHDGTGDGAGLVGDDAHPIEDEIDQVTGGATGSGDGVPSGGFRVLPRILAIVQKAARRPNLVVASAGLAVCFVAVLVAVTVNSSVPEKSKSGAQNQNQAQNQAQTSGGADLNQPAQPRNAQSPTSGTSPSTSASARGSGTPPQSRAAGTTGQGTGQGAGQANTTNRTPAQPTSYGYILGWGNKCIGASRRGTADGTVVDLYSCVNDDTQKWRRPGDGTIRTAGKCMEIAGGNFSNGVPIQINSCNGTPAQQWVFTSGYDLVNPYANKCLDLRGPSSADFTVVQIWDCNGAANQKWTVS